MKAQDIAEYIVSFSHSKGDPLTNKKLQKLLYYVEAWNLVYFGQIVDENFEAWVHGPVVPYVYGNFKKFVYSPIEMNYGGVTASVFNSTIAEKIGITGQIKDLTDQVIYKYGALSSFELEMLSHSEQPWLVARGDLPPTVQSNAIIDRELMKSYYSSLIKK